MKDDELLDLVDESDRVIGQMLRSKIAAEHLSNFRVINALIRNSKGELWIPRRTADKRLFPSCLDVSVGGHVESGETYDATFRREAQEELNLDINTVPYHLLGKLTPHEHAVSAFMQVYEITSDETPEYNRADFSEYEWIAPKAFLDRFLQGERVKGDLPLLVKKFYLQQQPTSL